MFAASFESEYCLLLQSLSTCHLPLLPLTLSSCAILYLGKGSSLHLLSIRTGGKKEALVGFTIGFFGKVVGGCFLKLQWKISILKLSILVMGLLPENKRKGREA